MNTQNSIWLDGKEYKLVPVEPTDAMLGAGLGFVDGMASMPCAWRAMLNAAPETPARTEAAPSNCKECRNADSWGMPDKPICRSCSAGSNWTALNQSSVNPNKRIEAPAEVWEPFQITEEMVTLAAKELCKIHAGECQVDYDDTWLIYSNQFKRDARCALEAAHGIKVGTKLYTHPAPAEVREPLTREQVQRMWREFSPLIGGIFDLVAAVEKHHGITRSKK